MKYEYEKEIKTVDNLDYIKDIYQVDGKNIKDLSLEELAEVILKEKNAETHDLNRVWELEKEYARKMGYIN